MPMAPYRRIVVALDGSPDSDLAADIALSFARNAAGTELVGCHVYAARMHRTRFEQMEPGLPERYHEGERLSSLRNTHDDLISSGMQLISDAYLAPVAQRAKESGIRFSPATREGRNYIELLRLTREQSAGLVALGANGQGKVPESVLGSLTERVLLHAPDGCDVLVARSSNDFRDQPIVVGVDGSPGSDSALARAVSIAATSGAPVRVVTVFDPFFHAGVFRTIADTLPAEARERFNFPAQERLHDEIIDAGLEQLYREHLEQGIAYARSCGVSVTGAILKGKAFPQILHDASSRDAALIVVGRYGRHRETGSLIGATALELARAAGTNVLVVAPSAEPIALPNIPESPPVLLPWTPEAEEVLQRIPSFARSMARKAVEDKVRKDGGSEVSRDAVLAAGGGMGMRGKAPDGTREGLPVAEMVVLKKVKRLAPGFHRHILKSRIIGQSVKPGDRVMVYEVVETVPPGPVRVTEQTLLEFR
jgi:nucleotide-binding universal stress UspA family protein